jgi:hypothetical protein
MIFAAFVVASKECSGRFIPLKRGRSALAKSNLLHSGKNPFSDALDNVGAEPVFPSRFVFADAGKADQCRRLLSAYPRPVSSPCFTSTTLSTSQHKKGRGFSRFFVDSPNRCLVEQP